MHVVEGRHQLDLFRQQHAVAEHIAAHIADAHHGKGRCLDILARFPEVTLDAFPGTAGSNAHLFVVVAGAAARGKSITQPETVFFGQAIGDIRKGGGALVGGHHQIGIIAIMANHGGRRHYLICDPVIRDIQQPANKFLVAGDTLLLPGVPVRRGAPFEHKAALGPHRHDNGVLHHLRLHQAQHFGTEILTPVGPAQPAPGHRTTAQVNTLHLG